MYQPEAYQYNPSAMESDYDIGKAGDYGLINPRLGFIRKVYGILSAQLALTTLICSFAVTSKGFQAFMIGNIWLLFLVVILSFAILIPLACCKSVARQVPINYYLLAGFTFCEGYLVGFICIEYEPMTVLQAAIMTTALVFTLTAYAFTTKTDFTVYTGIMLCFLVCLLLFGIFLMFFHSELLRTIYLALGVLCFGIYLIIDTQMAAGLSSLS